MPKRCLAVLGALAFVASGCGGSSSKAATPASRPTTSSTLAVATTIAGVLPGDTSDLHVSATTAPAGVVAPRAKWLRIERPDGKTQLAAVMRPAGGGSHPVVVYLHGSSGLNELLLAHARRLADSGFIVVAGCYLAVDPQSVKATPHFWVPCPGLPSYEHADPATTATAYNALLDAAQGLPDAKPGALGVFGESYGAITALTAAEPQLQAIVADSGYGDAGTAPVTAPVLLLGMESDPNVAHAKVLAFGHALRAANKTVESHYYPGAGHVATLQIATPAIADDATNRAEAFFHQHLG